MKSTGALRTLFCRVAWASMLVLGGCSAQVEADGAIETGVSGPGLDLEQTIVLCESNADCADLERGSCEMVICQEEGYCVSLPVGNGTPCDDGNTCTIEQVCEGGLCGGGVNDCPCDTDSDCGHLGEGDLCDGGLVCIGGGCEPDPAGPVTCEDMEGDCVTSACDPATGACLDTPTPDGAACATDNACLTGATCMEGACQGGSAVECPGGGQCVTSTCDSAVGCVNTPTNEGEACNDGNPCSDGDTCALGVCVGDQGSCECENDDDCLPYISDLCVMGMECQEGTCVAYTIEVDCPAEPGAACSQPACDPVTGACGVVGAPDGTDCATGPCDAGAKCHEGECLVPNGACDDGDPCTADECDDQSGCTNTPLDGGPCDDGNPCSAGDSCVEGACWPGQDVCVCETSEDCSGEGFDQCLGDWSCESGACVVMPNTAVTCDDLPVEACQVAQCQPSTGECVVHAAADGVACEDGNACTQDDSCSQGTCAGTLDDCDDDNPCTDDSCKPNSGCKHLDNSQPCDDSNACTSSDFCIAGSCFGGAAVQCPSSIPCTEGVCDPVQGCVAEIVADGTICDDGTDCTVSDTCTGGVCSGESICECLTDADCATSENDDLCDGTLVCVSGACEIDQSSIVVCPAGGPCQAATCDPATGSCSFDASQEAESCDPGPCMTQGLCVAGECKGDPVDCDDGQPCTENKCSLTTGLCVSEPKSGACDDSDPCTLNESCDGGLCSGGLFFPCNDQNPCTTDVCEPGVGCTFEPVVCDDGDACTADSCNAQGACVFAEKICGANSLNSCQAGFCDAATGECVPGQAPDGTGCTDQNACTVEDACLSGVCVPGEFDLCDDSNACTIDVCSPTSGCSNEPMPCGSDDPCLSASCEDGECVFTPVNSPNCTGEGVACNGTNGSSCDDDDGDTSSDICVQGICRGFRKQNLYADQNEGNVRLTGVDHAHGKWFMIVQIFGGNVGTVNELIMYGEDGNLGDPELKLYGETALAPAWTDMHEGFAVHEGGELWRYNPNTDSWSGENDLGDTFIEHNLIHPSSIWVHRQGGGELRLWATGEPNTQAHPVLTCSENLLDNGSVDVDCDAQQLNTNYEELMLKAVAGTPSCSGGACGYHLLLGADYPGDEGDFTDIFENYSGFDDSWTYTFSDSQVQEGHTTYDVSALGDQAYLVVGGGGYVRHRAPDGDLSWLPSLKNNQTQRDFRGVWSGAGTVVMAATRDLNSGPDAEIWTASTSANVTSGGSWTVLKLADLAEGSLIHDVWGDDQGNICVVGEEVLGNGATAAVIFRR